MIPAVYTSTAPSPIRNHGPSHNRPYWENHTYGLRTESVRLPNASTSPLTRS
jgi:hypothetical protein